MIGRFNFKLLVHDDLVGVETIREIFKGEHITVFYSDSYFGEQNEECRCDLCCENAGKIVCTDCHMMLVEDRYSKTCAICKRQNLKPAHSKWPHRIPTLKEKISTKCSVLVVSGSGQSVAAGFPCFRGLQKQPKTGKFTLKELMSANTMQTAEGEAALLKMNATLFELSKSAKPTAFHHLIESFHFQGILQRVVTQNIDCIELQLDIPRKLLIFVHGQVQRMYCTLDFQHSYDIDEEILSLLLNGTRPICRLCKESEEATVRSARIQNKRKNFQQVGILDFGYLLYDRETPGNYPRLRRLSELL